MEDCIVLFLALARMTIIIITREVLLRGYCFVIRLIFEL